MIRYPKQLKNADLYSSERMFFRRAVIHGLCYGDQPDISRQTTHTYRVGFWIGWLEAWYNRKRYEYVSFYDDVVDEVQRLRKELDSAGE